MHRVLGVDPGSRITGFGIIDYQGPRLAHVASGAVAVTGGEIGARLAQILDALRTVLLDYRPQEFAIEQVFMHRNAQSALKLGQARGVAIVAAAESAVPVFEYTATQIKQATTGRGHAAKPQIQHMVKALLRLDATPAVDAADALAVAICHSHHQQTRLRVAAAVRPAAPSRGARR